MLIIIELFISKVHYNLLNTVQGHRKYFKTTLAMGIVCV